LKIQFEMEKEKEKYFETQFYTTVSFKFKIKLWTLMKHSLFFITNVLEKPYAKVLWIIKFCCKEREKKRP